MIATAVTARRPRTRYTIGREAALLPLLTMMPTGCLTAYLPLLFAPIFPGRANEKYGCYSAFAFGSGFTSLGLRTDSRSALGVGILVYLKPMYFQYMGDLSTSNLKL